jgi:DNA-binding CsgD family transcriptional regulator/tetratricopeptide (TPR) repeat protein
MGVVDELIRAREAYERRDWVAAYGDLSHADADAMNADDFARLATSAYLLGRTNDCLQAMQRAYQGHLASGDVLAAVHAAFWLAMVLNESGEPVVGAGWIARGQRLLDGVTGDVVERGYLLVHQMFGHVSQGEFPEALEHAGRIAEYGHRFNDPDLIAMGLAARGRLLLYSGQVPRALALMDEAMVGLAAGEVSPIFAGTIYCTMIEGCQEVSDFARAAEWTHALTTWCDVQPGLIPFTAQCAVHRGQIMRVRGAYDEALEEFDLAVRRYVEAGTPAPAGLAMSERGDVLRIRGELGAAAAAYEEAIGYGHEPQPGLALLWLAQDRPDAARAAVRRLIAEPRDPVHRSQLLPASIEVLLATGGEPDEVRPLVEELSGIAASFGCPAMRAMAAYAAGSLALVDGDPMEALPLLRTSMRHWSELSAPYEVARCHLLIGRVFLQVGDHDSAAGELAAARRTFVQLGAAAVIDVDLAAGPASVPGGLTSRELEVLRLVASGQSNHDIASTLVLSEKTVGRHISNIFAKIDVHSRTAAAAYAFENRLV